MAVDPIPAGYHSVTPNIIVKDCARVIEFAKQAFAAHERMRFDTPEGSVAHAEIQIGDSIVMVADASEQFPPHPSILLVYVNDVDATYTQALAAGGKSLREPANAFYGDRTGGVQDVAGNQWWIATHVEDVSVEEMQKRAQMEHATAG